ncbi:three-prime repair exonuclease 1 [Episyrphus balteatus]|uniref:three-prime repair exonuclease 1 n=1 Tax=Episyrphus balteatus TaxID=286459 RepID=UPI0024861E81|nr:three-prime repair exonuclease 1 [Episyrphus balteatus]
MASKISSFAVFDLETPGLPDHSFNKGSITEISIHGFKADDVANSVNCKDPRINHTLTLLFNPRMMIHPESEKITGLDNYMLENESSFDDNAANVIISFLKHMQQPVCLVAHNGDKFDFPILKHALSKLGLELPSNVLCIDSLGAIKDLDLAKEDDNDSFTPLPTSDPNLNIEHFATLLKNDTKSEHIGIEPPINQLSESVSDVEVNKLEVSTNNYENEKEETLIASSEVSGKLETPADWQTFNETTPSRPPNVVNLERKRKRLNDEESSSTPAVPKSRKSLSFNPTPTKVGNYKLGSIYERLFDRSPVNAHHAEADVITLKKIMLRYGKSFVDYAEKNAKPFSEVKKLGAR